MKMFKQFLVALLMVPMLSTYSYSSPLNYVEKTADNAASLTTQISVSQIGRLAVPRGLVNINGSDVEVQAVPEGLFDPRPVLNGVLIKPEATSGKIRGLTYFFAGSWLNYLSQAPSSEKIATVSGQVYSGRILDGDSQSLRIGQEDGTEQSINFNEITDIQSPRAFTFLIITSSDGRISAPGTTQADARDIRFSSNNGGQLVVASKRPVPKLLGDEQGITKSQLASFLMLDFVALAAPMIAAPLVLGRGNNGARNLEAQVNRLNAGQ